MPGLNCNFRIEEVQECDDLLNPSDSDEDENDWLNHDALSVEHEEYNGNMWDSLSSGETDSSDEETSDDRSEDADNKLSNSSTRDHFDVNAISPELRKMDPEQRELAQNLIAAVIHEGVMGRLTPNTVLKVTTEENIQGSSTPESS